MLKRVHIKGFKSIWDADVSLGKVNVFIGTNGSGKSNFLEAIATLSSSFEGGIDYERLSRRGARLSSPEIFRSSLKHRDRLKTFTLEADMGELIYTSRVSCVDKFNYHSESLDHSTGKHLAGRSNVGTKISGMELPAKLEPSKSIMSLYSAFEAKEHVQKILHGLENFGIYSPSTPILRGVSPDNSKRGPLGLYGGRLAESLAEVLQDSKVKDQLQRFFTLLDWFRSVGSTEHVDRSLISDHVSFGRYVVTYRDKFMKGTFDHLYGYDVSEGALHVLFVLLLLIHKEAPNIFAIDNVDNGLNPGLVSQLMAHIVEIVGESKHKQVFLTTHNPTTLDAIDLFNDEHRLFVVQRKEDGQTEFRRIQPPAETTKSDWQEKYMGLKLSEIWLSGALGGLPLQF